MTAFKTTYFAPVLAVSALTLMMPGELHGPCGRCLPLSEEPASLVGPRLSDNWWARRPVFSGSDRGYQMLDRALHKSGRDSSNY